MKFFGTIFIVNIILLIALFSFSYSVYAEDIPKEDISNKEDTQIKEENIGELKKLYVPPPPKVSVPKKMARKLSRGVVNVFTAIGELAKQPIIEADAADSIVGVPAGCLTGFFTGIGWTMTRLLTGVFDIVTFPLPINNYEPLVEPEFII